jgi:hypothetical protein
MNVILSFFGREVNDSKVAYFYKSCGTVVVFRLFFNITKINETLYDNFAVPTLVFLIDALSNNRFLSLDNVTTTVVVGTRVCVCQSLFRL